jgi:hypothetical protein
LEITQEMIDDAIKNCKWLSQNRGFETAIPDICSGTCLPCSKVIDNGQCDTLIELFRGKKMGE